MRVCPCSSDQRHPGGLTMCVALVSCLQVPRFRHSQQVHRPGIPNPIELSAFKLADKPSPPFRDDDKVCARVLPAQCCLLLCV